MMTEEEVVTLMGSSKNEAEWDANADKVKAACDGYPAFWYNAVILSGLCDKTLGQGASDLNVITLGQRPPSSKPQRPLHDYR